MSEHLTQEQISALLEAAGPDRPPAQRHVEACERCRKELQRMRRMRMALSALDDLEAPAGLWSRIESRLPGPEAGGGEEDVLGLPFAAVDSTWLRAAAAILLFVGGVALGSRVGMSPDAPGSAARAGDVAAREGTPGGETGSDGSAPATPAPEEPRASDPEEETAPPRAGAAAGPGAGEDALAARAREAVPGPSSAPSAEKADRRSPADVPSVAGSLGDPAYRRALERLGVRAPGAAPSFEDRSEAVRRLAELDGLIRASREALQADPANPAVNELLFRAMEEREALNDALRFSALEIR